LVAGRRVARGRKEYLGGMRHSHSPSSSAWLWRLALYIAVAGGGLSYYLSRNVTSAEARTRFVFVLFLTILGVGLCVICATRNWWLKR
jgi:hypothetical protein